MAKKYRMLKEGERYREGDEWQSFFNPKDWHKIGGHSLDKKHGSFYLEDTIVRRPVKRGKGSGK